MQRRWGTLAAGVVLLLVITALGIGCRQEERVTARYWVTDPIGTNVARKFPERAGELAVARTTSSETPIGVCFSGGGVRSAAATLGQLRALHTTGLIDRVGYISCVSGGAWAAVPYTFVSSKNDETFLGDYIAPRDLRRENFSTKVAGSYAAALSETEMPNWFGDLFRAAFSFVGLRDNEYFGKQLERCLLKPFGLDGRYRFLTQDRTSLDAIRRRNPRLSESDFRMPDSARPFLIVNGVIRRYDFWIWDWNRPTNKRLPLEMTPLYVGLPHHFQDVGASQRSLGGTYVEPLAYGADEVEKTPGSTISAVLHSDWAGVESQRFNVIDMIAISGSAPAEYGAIAHVAFPRLPSWSANNPPETKVETYYHADGGHAENLGIMPLLARRVPMIIAFVNAGERGVPGYVRELFGQKTEEYGDWHSRAVFPPEKLADLEAAMKHCANDGLPFHIDTYRVSPDAEDMFNLHLLPGEIYDVKIAWFFLENTRWSHQLSTQVDYWMQQDKDDFANFPRYETFLNRKWFLIDPTIEQVQALAHLTSWLVVDRAPEIRTYFGGPCTQPAAGHMGGRTSAQ